MESNQLDTPLKALRFAIDFAQMDLDRAGLKLVSDTINDFFVLLPGAVRGKPRTLAELKTVQIAVLRLLKEVLGFGVSTFQGHFTFIVARAGLGVSRLGSTRIISAPNGSLRDRFLFRVKELLEEFGVEKLKECPAPGCQPGAGGRLFFKVTQKKFCSTRCQARVNSRNYYNKKLSAKIRKGALLHGKTTRTR